MIRLAFTDEVAAELQALLTDGGNEAGAFCLLREGRGHEGTRLLASEIVPGAPDAWDIQATDQLRPSARGISAAISHAISGHAGLLFVHTHPNRRHPLGFSHIDERSFRSLAETLAPMLDGPFAAAVIHADGWTGRLWDKGELVAVDSAAGVGRVLRFFNPSVPSRDQELDNRQIGALGSLNDRLRRLTVGVVGVGGLGSPLAEQLVRMGVEHLIGIDDDVLDTPSNIRRVFGAKMSDLARVPAPSKVEIVVDHLRAIGLETQIDAVRGDVRTEGVFRRLLDCDIVFADTDTHGSRAILNELASTYLLPVIDTGVRVGAKTGNRLAGLITETRVLTPSTPCLWCRRTINADVIREENLPVAEREQLAREGYVSGETGAPAPSVAALTVLGSGQAACAMLALLSDEAAVVPSAYWIDGFLGDAAYPKPAEPVARCRCRAQLGLGDSAAPPFVRLPRKAEIKEESNGR